MIGLVFDDTHTMLLVASIFWSIAFQVVNNKEFDMFSSVADYLKITVFQFKIDILVHRSHRCCTRRDLYPSIAWLVVVKVVVAAAVAIVPSLILLLP